MENSISFPIASKDLVVSLIALIRSERDRLPIEVATITPLSAAVTSLRLELKPLIVALTSSPIFPNIFKVASKFSTCVFALSAPVSIAKAQVPRLLV